MNDKSDSMNSSMSLAKILLPLSFILSLARVHAEEPVSEERLRQVAYSREWLKLLHYEPNMWGQNRSLIDGPEFFFAKDGNVNPLAELKASLDGLKSNVLIGKLKQPPVCAFPERYRFLKEKFGLDAPRRKCEKFEEFIGQFQNPRSVSLVFSSAYPNNPASMFGHTFLKINSLAGSDLNDQGLNFAAYVPDDDNGIAFAWFGMTGGYIGQWSNLPYYVKLNEYVNFESRDIWEYKLSLTREETLRLLAHLWEIETNTYFHYYFFDENCSYQILAALVAVKPEWEPILDHTIYVIPGETVKQVAEMPGAVTEVKYRPSHYKKLMQRFSQLTADEKKIFFAVADGEKKVEDVDSRFILDAVAVYYDYLRNEKARKFETQYKEKREILLSHRATLGPASREEMARLPAIDGHTRPDIGHDPYALTVGGGYHDQEGVSGNAGFTYFRIKSAYHDLLNNDDGYSRYAHIDFPAAEFRLDHGSGKLRLEELTGIAITSLHPVSQINFAPSFKVSVGLDTFRDYGCMDCRHVYGEAGIGSAMAIGDPRYMLYGMVQARAEWYSKLGRGYRYGPGLDLGLLLNPYSRYKIYFGAVHQWDLEQDDRADSYTTYKLHHSLFLSRNWEIRNTNDWIISKIAGAGWETVEYKIHLTYFFR